MTKAHFKFASEILKRLGEELNPSPDQGILELVKNAYDADARKCLIIIDSAGSGIIKVVDNGDGMTQEDIENAWLLIGKSAKNISKVTRLGRIPAGNKGLGRLAALRMGNKVSLTTRPKISPHIENSLEIDWSEFDNASAVENVELTIESGRHGKTARPGTVITLSELKTRFTEADVRRLVKGLLLLADPFNDKAIGFKPILRAPEFKKLEKIVRRRYFDDAELHLESEVDKNGWASAKVVDWQGNILYSAQHSDLRPKTPDEVYKCPPVKFDLWVFLLSGEHFLTRESTLSEVRDWLKEFGGVHFYIRGLRVPPYGNPGNDWLDMNLSRAQHPELRPSTNTSIGRISTDDLSELLLPKTDRSGIVENESFHEIRNFAIDSLAWMSKRRLDERNKRLEAQKKETSAEVKETRNALNMIIGALPKEKRKEAKQQLQQFNRLKDKESEILRKQLQLYRLLGTAGIAATVFAHESKHSIDVISRNSKLIEKLWKKISKIEPPPEFKDCIERITSQSEALQTFGGLTLSFVSREKRRLGRIEIHQVISNVISLFEPLVNERKITVRQKFVQGQPFFRTSEATLESVIANLLVNSIKAFEQMPPGERIIEFRTHTSDNTLFVRVLDNGPGIKGLNVNDIWLPGETTYSDGTGLGLTIVRDSIVEFGGSAEAKAKGELGGAEIILQIPILGI